MTNIFLTVLEISISSSVLIAVLIMFSPLLNRRYAAKWKYWIWILFAMRLIIPFNREDIKSMADSWLRTETQYIWQSGKIDTDYLPEQAMSRGRVIVEIPAQMATPLGMPFEGGKTNITLLDVAAVIWMTGSLVFILAHLVSYMHYKRQALRGGKAIRNNDILRQMYELKHELRIKDAIRIIEYPEAASPMMLGFLEPVLILPDVRHGSEELYFILKHELVHLKRRDVYMKLLLTAANAVHWFNPLVWIMQKEAAVDMELSCDERVMQGTNYEVRKAYTETLLSTLHRQCTKRTVLSTQFYGGKNIMKKRFKNILLNTDKKNGAIILMLAVVLTVGAGTLVGCSVANAGSVSGQEESGSADGGIVRQGNGNTEDQIGRTGNENMEGQTGQPENGDAERVPGQLDSRDGQSAQGVDSQTAGTGASNMGTETSRMESSGTMAKIVYIEEFDGEKLTFDEVEWVQVPGERAAELGITEDDAPSGFSVYNEEMVSEEMLFADDCIYTLLDWTSNYMEMQVTVEELMDILAEREGMAIPYHLIIKNNEIISFTEQYIP